jgi:hypothetical protein
MEDRVYSLQISHQEPIIVRNVRVRRLHDSGRPATEKV